MPSEESPFAARSANIIAFDTLRRRAEESGRRASEDILRGGSPTHYDDNFEEASRDLPPRAALGDEARSYFQDVRRQAFQSGVTAVPAAGEHPRPVERLYLAEARPHGATRQVLQREAHRFLVRDLPRRELAGADEA